MNKKKGGQIKPFHKPVEDTADLTLNTLLSIFLSRLSQQKQL